MARPAGFEPTTPRFVGSPEALESLEVSAKSSDYGARNVNNLDAVCKSRSPFPRRLSGRQG
jgi:hypothetical protein